MHLIKLRIQGQAWMYLKVSIAITERSAGVAFNWSGFSNLSNFTYGKLLVPTGMISANPAGQQHAGIKVKTVSPYQHQKHPFTER